MTHFYDRMLQPADVARLDGRLDRAKWRKALMVSQGERCGICRVSFYDVRQSDQRPCVDHDHTSGRVRGLLCNACNISLGRYERSQRPAGLHIAPYDTYLQDPPAFALQV